MKIEATTRSTQGTSASRRLRRAGRVPGIVYGGAGEPAAIELDHNSLYHSLRVESFHSTILDLSVEGKSESVLLRNVQWHPFKRQVLHIDFQRINANQKVHLSVPLHFVNQEESPAIKQQGAVVSHVLTEIEVSCLPKDLPEYIEVDMIEMSVDKSVHISDLKMPAGVESVSMMHEQDPVIATATIKGGPSAESEEAAAASGSEEGNSAASDES